MARDPYSVLGLGPTATNDAVKSAYRRLAKKYHPDLNPGSKEAEQKMKEINEAYDTIINGKYNPNAYSSGSSNGNSSYGSSSYGGSSYGSGSYGGGSYGGARYQNGFYGAYQQGFRGFDPFGGSAYGSHESEQLRAVRSHLNMGHYAEARSMLASIPNHDAYWYYLSALANEGLGNHLNAVDHAKKAAAMEPDNFEYVSLARRLDFSGGAQEEYNTRYTPPGRSRYLGLILCCLFNMFCGRGFFCI